MDEELKNVVEELIGNAIGPVSESIEDLKASLAALKQPEGQKEEEKNEDPNRDHFMDWASEERSKK